MQGLGDLVEKFTHFFGLDLVAKRVARIFGYEDCGCTRRKNKLNKAIPFKKRQ